MAKECFCLQGFFSSHAIGSKSLFLLHACDSNKDVRDPSAEMTSILPSCHSVPTVCARKTGGDIDIYVRHTCEWGFCVIQQEFPPNLNKDTGKQCS